ncbi:hypothetical protein AT15_01095 [Kosmotoga arenicorallina S304]|uniref:ROK family protein n=1 Tax=Kosmotoga arenicorallina S304 TaxID=1453497 RepID=A0A176K0J4_9BACT|nr:ROK family protein [Kosmotoga arenicorallina]OAA30143.1 hypothetical protein AT15_01095 [Kosmotoga arenicorallina S304]
MDEIRWDNLTRLLEQVFIEKEVSRKTLSKKVGVRNSTLSYLLRSLIRFGMVNIKNVSYGRGRPNQMISLNPQYGNVMGIKIGRESLNATVFDFSLSEVESIVIPFDNTDNLEKNIVREMQNLILNYRPLTMGFAVSGTVDLKEKEIFSSPILNLKEFDLKEVLKARGLDFLIFNDVDALHVGQMVESGIFDRTSLTVTFGVGIGASFFDGEDILTSGDGKSTFELGHMTADPDGAPCYCGRKGCIETVASEYSLIGNKPSIKEFVEKFGDYREEIKEIRSAAKAGKGRGLYKPVLRKLGCAISDISLLLRPSLIWIGGEGLVSKWIFDEIKSEILAQIPEGWGYLPEIRLVKSVQGWQRGAAFLALRHYIREKLK